MVSTDIAARVKDESDSCIYAACRNQDTQASVSTAQTGTQCTVPLCSAGSQTETDGAFPRTQCAVPFRSAGSRAETDGAFSKVTAAFLQFGACCERCGEFFSSEITAEDHWQLEHEGRPEQTYKCSYCPYSHHIKKFVYEHETTHSGEKPYSCRFCSQSFRQRSKLTIHERTHTPMKRCFPAKFVCKVCQHRCSSRGSLSIHERTHTGYILRTPHTTKTLINSFCRQFDSHHGISQRLMLQG